MCGIAGILVLGGTGAPPERESLLRMAGALSHRGPDEYGVYRDARAGLAHARLSIIDVRTGQQPLANEDDSLWIVFNGEIFNYLELREDLERLGHRFRTRSDTEVIVHAYEAWGNDAFSRMNGQWALALWDSTRRRLVLARDRMGVRPLFVCKHRQRLYFASEVKALFAGDASIPRALDPRGIAQTFTFWASLAPQSVFRGVEELRPAHVRIYDDTGMREHEYWRADYPERAQAPRYEGSLEDAARDVRAALERATRLRVERSDVPVGSYLSGGLDSSIVAGLGRDIAGSRFQTFSLRFQDSEYDETRFQRLMAAQLRSEHHEIEVSREDIAGVFPDVVYHAERPLLRTAPAPLFLLSGLVRKHGIKVVLTGEGADEIFGGYDLFKEGKVRRFWAQQPASALRPRLLERLYPYLTRSPVAQRALSRQFFGRNLEHPEAPGFAHDTRWQTTRALHRLFSPALRAALASTDVVSEFCGSLPAAFRRWSALSQDQYIEIRTLLSSYLLSSQGDRMLMAHSVEGRFPFLDKDVIALADSLPDRYKLHVLDEKRVLKRAARGLVPDEILARQKQPYRAPDALSFLSPHAPDYVEEMLGEQAVTQAEVFDPEAVRKLWNKCRTRADQSQFSNTDNMALVGILSTQLLHQAFVRERPFHDRNLALATDVDRTR